MLSSAANLLFIDNAQRALDDSGVEVTFSDTKFTVTGSGDRRTVAIDGFTMHASANGDDVTLEGKDGCAVMTIGDTTTDTCAGGSSVDSVLKAVGLDDNKDVQVLVTTVRDAFSDLGPVGLTVQKVDGKWFFSPIGTELDVWSALMGALDKTELTEIIDGVKKVSRSLTVNDIFGFGAAAGSFGSLDGTGSSGLEACLAETDYPVFSTCVAQGIDDGSIDATFVPPYFRFFDCGAGQRYFDGTVYSMSDEEFTAFATDAAPCFQRFVDDGILSQFELPYELSRPDCLEGRNWYNVTDADYNERVATCVG